jgi:hypothetical protein
LDESAQKINYASQITIEQTTINEQIADDKEGPDSYIINSGESRPILNNSNL